MKKKLLVNKRELVNDFFSGSVEMSFINSLHHFEKRNELSKELWLDLGIEGRLYGIWRKFIRLKAPILDKSVDFIDMLKLLEECQDLVVYSVMCYTLIQFLKSEVDDSKIKKENGKIKISDFIKIMKTTNDIIQNKKKREKFVYELFNTDYGKYAKKKVRISG